MTRVKRIGRTNARFIDPPYEVWTKRRETSLTRKNCKAKKDIGSSLSLRGACLPEGGWNDEAI